MTDERWQLAYAIYEAAAALAEAERQQYVRSAAPDAEIADKVLAMLNEMETITDSDALPKSAYSTDTTLAPLPAPTACRMALRSAVLSSAGLWAKAEWAESIRPTTPT